ncbi:MAG: DUF3298 domain-containing protein [Neisseriaceae bacterium]|nr:DUF3298 domain-containing protein [Neisseriaceae bacterium]
MIKQTITAILPIVLLLTACDFQKNYEKRKQALGQPEKTVQAENTPQNQANQAKPQDKMPLPPDVLEITSQEYQQNYCFDKKDPNRCSSIKLVRLQVANLAWLSAFLDKEIEWDSSKDETQVLENLKKSTLNGGSEENAYTVEIETQLSFLGRAGNLAVFQKEHYLYYELAAHGMNSIYISVLDLKTGKKVPLEQILVSPQSMTALERKQHEVFIQQLKQEHHLSDEEINGFNQTFPFGSSNNWRFTQNGLIFTYNPYEIAPYAYGNIELFLDKESLKGIIKDEYLTAIEKWVENNQTRQPETNKNKENNTENAPVYQQFVPPPQEREEFYPRSDFE